MWNEPFNNRNSGPPNHKMIIITGMRARYHGAAGKAVRWPDASTGPGR